MTDQSSPITPPPELVQQWTVSWISAEYCCLRTYLATQSAQWGWDQRGAINEAQLQERADQELEACCQLLDINGCPNTWIDMLRAARRPKPATLNSIALQMLGTIERDAHYLPEITDTIRCALEQLNDCPHPQQPPSAYAAITRCSGRDGCVSC
jgi:hypothetical protein